MSLVQPFSPTPKSQAAPKPSAELPDMPVLVKETGRPTAGTMPPVSDIVDTSWLSLTASDGLRPPDWRWLRAVYLYDHGQGLLKGFDDAFVASALKLVSKLRQGDGRRGLSELSQGGALEQALAVYTGPPAPQRAVLEAWLLTGLPTPAVSAKVGLREDIVLEYERFFFDVRDRLGAKGSIAHLVLRTWPNPEPTLGSVLRYYGYHGGPLVLERLLDLFGLSGPATVDDHVGNPGKWVDNGFAMKVAVLFWLLPVTTRTALPVLKLRQRLKACNWRRDSRVHTGCLGMAVNLVRKHSGMVDNYINEMLRSLKDNY
jgi:hypothetical protein